MPKVEQDERTQSKMQETAIPVPEGPRLPVVPVPAWKRKQPSTTLAWKRSKLQQAEYAPDNSRCGYESAGLQSRPERIAPQGATDREVLRAHLRSMILNGVGAALRMQAGIVEPQAVVVQGAALEPERALAPFIGPRLDAVLVRYGRSRQEYATSYAVERMLRPNINAAQTRGESKSWKQSRTAKQGQRPQVLRQRT